MSPPPERAVVRAGAKPGLSLADGVGVSTPARPGRVRNRNKAEVKEKSKQPADESRKKTPSTRKAPARGRYVDEYARSAW